MTDLSKYYAAEQTGNEEFATLPQKDTGTLLETGSHNEHASSLKILATCPHAVTGADHRYDITGFNASKNPGFKEDDKENILTILFQQGAVPEVGINGVTPESLLLCIQHLFTGYQTSKFACDENATVLEGVDMALTAIRARTADRTERGVEGTHEV